MYSKTQRNTSIKFSLKNVFNKIVTDSYYLSHIEQMFTFIFVSNLTDEKIVKSNVYSTF